MTAADLVVSRTPLSEDGLLARGIDDPTATEYCILIHQYAKFEGS